MTDILHHFGQFATSTICDACIKLGQVRPERILLSGLQPILLRAHRAAGRARTLRVEQVEGERPPSARGLGFGFIDDALSGDFLVLQASVPYAFFGGAMAQRAHSLGVAGLAIQGGVRDVDQMLGLGLPVWASAVTPYVGSALGYVAVELNGRVSIGSVEISPGDIVVADGDGVVSVSEELARALLPFCEAVRSAEVRTQTALLSGQRLLDSYGTR